MRKLTQMTQTMRWREAHLVARSCWDRLVGRPLQPRYPLGASSVESAVEARLIVGYRHRKLPRRVRDGAADLCLSGCVSIQLLQQQLAEEAAEGVVVLQMDGKSPLRTSLNAAQVRSTALCTCSVA